ncbi:4-hydroxy-3-methylbut-2-enyl diphosphate reductase [Candidatus Poribacteria bacterium]|nr:4-hydroxy-3-methylbut-2-enyl diphosphate reductase [Candidatus Poribacteria bacterium]
MPRTFKLPHFYHSPVISVVKHARRETDARKRDLSPTLLDFGPVRFKIARHFGFCYGVENAIEIAYQALAENPDKRIFLLSEIIHNPRVNENLKHRGVRFLMDTAGTPLLPFDILMPDDVVIVPAFGTTLEIEQALRARGVTLTAYNTTCPFVEKVWRRSEEIGKQDYTVVIHGKRYHEETRATFSHAQAGAPVVVVRDLSEAQALAKVISGEEDAAFFFEKFADRFSPGFDPTIHLKRIGVVNQTTMLASETQAIADLLREAIRTTYGDAEDADTGETHFADTRDTLCYATKENQDATLALIADGGDIAVVVGGYNSSNTSHLVELCQQRLPTYFIRDADELLSPKEIRHLDLETKQVQTTKDWLFPKNHQRRGEVPSPATDGEWAGKPSPYDIVLTAGASCPDVLLDEVLQKIVGWFPNTRSVEEVLKSYQREY